MTLTIWIGLLLLLWLFRQRLGRSVAVLLLLGSLG